MKKIVFYTLVIASFFLVIACGSDTSSIDANVTFVKELIAPEGVRFSYLMYEDDYNAIPNDGNAAQYSSEITKSEGAGMSFALTATQEYAPGANVVIEGSKEGIWCKISFDCFKKSEGVPDESKGFLVVSYHRGDSMVHYVAYPIYELLKDQNKQIVDKWERFHVWHQIPEHIEEGDRMKTYVWNPEGTTLYLDDFVVEVWTTERSTPKDVVLSHGIIEENYEDEAQGPQITREVAYRGLASCVLSAQGVAFGKGYATTLQEANIAAGDYIRVVFAALKRHKTRIYLESANMVVALEREGQQTLWKGTPIDPRIMKDGRQVLGDWVRLDVWEQIPADAKPTDIIKIYPWNAQNTPVYIDDLTVEVWK